MTKQIYLGELRNTDILAKITQELKEHQVTLFLEPGLSNIGGTGTVAIFDTLKGILTAAHVLAYFGDKEKNKVIYVALQSPDNDIFMKIEISFAKILTIDDLNACESKTWKDTRLDIAFIVLDDENFNKLTSFGNKKSVDLQNMSFEYMNSKDKYVSNDNRELIGIISGCPREKAHTISDNDKAITHFPYSGNYLGGPLFKKTKEKLKVPTKSYKGLISDLVSIQIGKSEDDLPDSFAGASGGGMWLFSIKDDYSHTKLFLGGIFVYANVQNNKDEILVSRGPISLYEIFCKYLNEHLKGVVK